MNRALLVVGWLWALPTTLLGLALAFGGLAGPYRIRPAGVLQFVACVGPWDWFFSRAKMAAVTIGFVTIFQEGYEDDADIIRHERCHSIHQASWLGVLYIPVYYLSCAVEWFLGRNAYRDCWMERMAYEHQRVPDDFG